MHACTLHVVIIAWVFAMSDCLHNPNVTEGRHSLAFATPYETVADFFQVCTVGPEPLFALN
jgi:hypothetical protein